MQEQTARLQRLEQARHDHVQAWRCNPVVEALHAWRGVPCTGAVSRVSAMGELTRVDHPQRTDAMLGPDALGICLRGATPAGVYDQSRQHPGPTGPGRRRLGQSRPSQGQPSSCHGDCEPPPKSLQDLSWKAQVRLCQRDRRLVSRGTHAHVVTVAMARELAGFMWAMARAGSGHTVRPPERADSTLNCAGSPRASEETQPRCGVPLGSVKRRVEATRASIEAGTRRRPVRW